MAAKPAKKAAAKPKGASPSAPKSRKAGKAKSKTAAKPIASPKSAARKSAVKPAQPPPPAAVPPAADGWQPDQPPAPAPPPGPWAPPPAVPGWAPPPQASPPAQPPVVPAVPAAPALAFDPATGNWVAPFPPTLPNEASMAPEAPHPSGNRRLAWNIVLGIDLGFLALFFLLNLFVGLVLVFAPESAQAEEFRGSFDGSTGLLVVETLFTFTMMGVIPSLWILFTRRVMWEGTKRYLKLHSPLVATIQGVVLTAVLLAAVFVLSAVYIVLTEGPDGLTLAEETEGDNPAVDAILDNLTWPVAILISVCAGVGEEILFRGILLRKIGLWGQAAVFGLAHAAGGYLPQILFAFGLAVLFGYLLKRGVSLWALILAHVLYDLVLLSIGLVFT